MSYESSEGVSLTDLEVDTNTTSSTSIWIRAGQPVRNETTIVVKEFIVNVILENIVCPKLKITKN